MLISLKLLLEILIALATLIVVTAVLVVTTQNEWKLKHGGKLCQKHSECELQEMETKCFDTQVFIRLFRKSGKSS